MLRQTGDEYYRLQCPQGHHYTHQGKVEVWLRKEDDPEGIYVSIDGLGIIHTDAHAPMEAGMPSLRRSGYRIWFECEECGEGSRFAVDIAQHKGETLISYHR